MKFLQIRIEEFGCLCNRTFDLSEPFVLILGKNESGKSTLLSFIHFIFYGLPRKSQDTAAERDRSLGWKSGIAAGSLLLETAEGQFTIERRCIRRGTEKRETVSDEVKIVNEATGMQVFAGKVPGEIFFGVPASVFDSTCCVRQLGVTKMETGDVSNALENLLFSADETLCLQKTLDKLEARRKELMHKNGKGGSLPLLEQQGEALCARLEAAKEGHESLLVLRHAVQAKKEKIDALRIESQKLDDMFSACHAVAVLKNFDRLHETERAVEACRSEYEAYRKQAASADGFLPDVTYVSELSLAADGYLAARAESDRAEARYRAAEARMAAEDRRGRHVGTAEEILRRSTPDELCAQSEIYRKKLRAGKRNAVLGFVLAALLVGFGVASYIFLFQNLSLLGGLLAGGLLCLLGGLLSVKSLQKNRRRLGELYARIGLEPQAGTERLRAELTDLLDAEAEADLLAHEVALASSARTLRQSDLEAAAAKADSLLARWGLLPTPDRADALQSAKEKAKEVCLALSRYESKLAGLSAGAETLANELSSYNERQLRSRVTKQVLSDFEQKNITEVERQRSFCISKLRSLTEQCAKEERELYVCEKNTENPARVAVELEENQRAVDGERLAYDAISAAAEALEKAGSNIRERVTPLLRKEASGYLSRVTNGKYESLGLDGGYAMSAATDYGTRPMESLSAGTKDVAYLALRLALLSTLYKDERPVLLLDEALAQLDEERAARALALLADFCRGGGQCLLFSCHDRERRLLPPGLAYKSLQMEPSAP